MFVAVCVLAVDSSFLSSLFIGVLGFREIVEHSYLVGSLDVLDQMWLLVLIVDECDHFVILNL